MNLCAAGDLGVPAETAAMADGMGWANLQFESPFGRSDSNSSDVGNATNVTAITLRRLLQINNQTGNQSADEREISKVTYHEKKETSKLIFHGNLMTGVAAVAVEALVHIVLTSLMYYFTEIPHHCLPAALRFPGSEIESFLSLWNPLCLSSTIAFARHATSFVTSDQEHWITILLAVLCLSLVELPFLIWYVWYLFKSLYGEEGVRTLMYKKTPISKQVLSTRPTCKFLSLTKVKYQLCLALDWIEWIFCLPFRLSFQGVWVDDPNSPTPGEVAVYGPLFMKYSPAMVSAGNYYYLSIHVWRYMCISFPIRVHT